MQSSPEHTVLQLFGKVRHGLGNGLSISKRLARDALHFALPPVCLGCRKPVGTDMSLCPACWSKMDFIHAPVCDRLGLPFKEDPGETTVSISARLDPPIYGRCRAVAHYTGVARDLVHHLKFHDRLELAKPMATWMARAGADILQDADFILPMPLHRLRLFLRRYNQAALLSAEIAKQSGTWHLVEGLARIRRTKRQVGLDKVARRVNVQGAFRVPVEIAGLISGSRVVLVDDVMTSGASVDAAVRALKRAGVREVDVLVFCRVAIEDMTFIYQDL